MLHAARADGCCKEIPPPAEVRRTFGMTHLFLGMVVFRSE